MRTYAPLCAVLGLFAIFTWLFITATPYREDGVLMYQRNPETGQYAQAADIGAPDERQHANYIRDLVAGKGFPVLRTDDPDLYENYQAHQPPAYYIIAAGWSKLTGADPESQDGGRKLRLLSLLIGMGTLAGAYFLAFWGTGRRDVAAGAAAFGLIPMFVALHGAVSNDPLLYLCCTWAMAFMVKAVVEEWTIKRAVIIGALIGLGILTKTSAVGLLGVLLIAGLLSLRAATTENRKKLLLPAVLCAMLPLVLAAPWWMRNNQLYGDPLAMSVFNSAFKGSPQASDFIQGLGAKAYWLDMVCWWTTRSFIGVFGYMDIFLFEKMGAASSSIYLLLIFAVLGIFVAGAVALGRKPKDDDEAPSGSLARTIALAAIVIYIVLLLQFNKQYFQGQARYIYPAFGAFALLAGSGAGMLRGSLKDYSWVPLAAFFAVLDFLAWQQLGPAFTLRA